MEPAQADAGGTRDTQRRHAARSVRHALAAAIVLGGVAVGASTGGASRPVGPTSNCQTAGVARTTFPASGTWVGVDEQTFDVPALPAEWDPFSGYYDGGSGQGHHSFREPSMLAFPGSWMEFKNEVYATAPDGGYATIADAGANEAYHDTYVSSTGTTEEGYDVASHEWGFQWCARFNGGQGFDTAFAFVPTDGAWPPEIDFIEHGPKDGNTVTLHIHWRATRYNDGHYCDPRYPTTNTENCHAKFPSVSVVVSRWNSYAVTWSARQIDVWIDGRRINSLTVTPRICTQRADQKHGFGDTGTESLCLPNGYTDNSKSKPLEPYVWDMQVNSYTGTDTYAGDQTDLAWFRALRPQGAVRSPATRARTGR